jgi:GntR family transcriptional regulator/MocR family aminotransferase
MAMFMEEGHWERHIRRMRIIYKKKHDALLHAIEYHFGRTATVVGQGAGLHVVLQLPDDNPGETEIIRRAEQKGIRLLPFSGFSVTGEPDFTNLLLGFGGIAANEAEEGISLLSQLCI